MIDPGDPVRLLGQNVDYTAGSSIPTWERCGCSSTARSASTRSAVRAVAELPAGEVVAVEAQGLVGPTITTCARRSSSGAVGVRTLLRRTRDGGASQAETTAPLANVPSHLARCATRATTHPRQP